MKSFLATLAAALCLTATTALASGPVVPHDPPVVPPTIAAYNWNGAYAGIAASAPLGSVSWFTEMAGGVFSAPTNWEGLRGTLALGYNRHSGAMVYGVEGNITLGTMSALNDVDLGVWPCGLMSGCLTEVSNLVEIRGRVGRAVDRTLFFVSVGVASAEVTASTPFFGGIHGQDRLTGYSLGLGVEQAVGARTRVRLEYIHTNLGTLAMPTGCAINCRADIGFGTLRLGALINF